MRMKAVATEIARRTKINSRYVEDKVGNGAGYLKPFLAYKITLIVVETHSNGKSYKRDF